MQIPMIVLASVVGSRVLRSGDDKGQVKHSVDVYAHTGDNVPSKFAITGLGSEAEAQAIAAKLTHGSRVVVNFTPRDVLYLDNAAQIQPVAKS